MHILRHVSTRQLKVLAITPLQRPCAYLSKRTYSDRSEDAIKVRSTTSKTTSQKTDIAFRVFKPPFKLPGAHSTSLQVNAAHQNRTTGQNMTRARHLERTLPSMKPRHLPIRNPQRRYPHHIPDGHIMFPHTPEAGTSLRCSRGKRDTTLRVW